MWGFITLSSIFLSSLDIDIVICMFVEVQLPGFPFSNEKSHSLSFIFGQLNIAYLRYS